MDVYPVLPQLAYRYLSLIRLDTPLGLGGNTMTPYLNGKLDEESANALLHMLHYPVAPRPDG